MAENKDWKRTKGYKTLRKDLLDDLEARGLISEVYTESVERYMTLWVLYQEAQADMKERGLVVTDGRGAKVENRMISLSIQTSKEMRAIYADLGFKDAALKGGNAGAGDDEL